MSVYLLEITNLDDLKNKIIMVIIMVLIVSFFQRVWP
ncbi:MAG TPA: YqhA family protein [Methanoregulaceae archaeon]|nr:YqhA family protein [Methanoregulaceae archaeon]